jgi:hypothetical protein
VSITAKSVILDIADNWGERWLNIRSVEFFLNNTLIGITTEFSAYATSVYNFNTPKSGPQLSFDTRLPKTGSMFYNSWASVSSDNTNQRLIIVFDSATEFDKIVINNGVNAAPDYYTSMGVKNVVIKASTDAITDTTYNATITNSTLLFDGVIDQHVWDGVEDPQTVYTSPFKKGVFISPLVSLASVGNTPITGYTDFATPLAAIEGTGDTPITGYTDFVSPLSTLEGVGNTPITGYTDFISPIVSVEGVGDTPITGYTDLMTPLVSIEGEGTLRITGYGDIISPGVSIEGTSDRTITYTNGKPWRLQPDNTDQTGDIGAWTLGTALPVALELSQAIVTRERVYLFGGIDGAWISTVYTAPIVDGVIGAWTTGTNLPISVGGAQVIQTKARVYLMGGATGDVSYATYTAPINVDGTLGDWSFVQNFPAAAAYFSQAIVTTNRIYLLGSSASAIVYTAPIDVDGLIGAWAVATSLPADLSNSTAVVTKDRVYLLGGRDGAYDITGIVYTAPIDVNGIIGTWTTGTSLPTPMKDAQAIVTKDTVYLLGGDDGLYNELMYHAPIDVDGLIGAWVAGTSIVADETYNSQVIVTSTRIYSLGGANSGGAIAAVYYAPFLGGLDNYSASSYSDDYVIIDMYSPLVSVDGVGDLPITGYTDIISPLVSVEGMGDTPITGYTDFIPLIASIACGGNVYLFSGIGSVIPQQVSIIGSGDVSIICHGVVEPETASVAGVGNVKIIGAGHIATPRVKIHGDYSAVGNVEVSPPVIAGHGLVSIIGSGAVTLRPATVVGTGQLSLLGTVDYKTKAPTVTALGIIYPTGNGALEVSTPSITTYGYIRITGIGAVGIKPPVIVCRAMQPDDYTVIRHWRDGVCH